MGNNKLSDDAYRAALRRKVDSLANERAIVNGNGYGNEWIKNKRRFYFSKQMKKKRQQHNETNGIRKRA